MSVMLHADTAGTKTKHKLEKRAKMERFIVFPFGKVMRLTGIEIEVVQFGSHGCAESVESCFKRARAPSA